MFHLNSLSFRNFRSYGKTTTTINFDSPGTTLIVGRSEDGSTTNGLGKTSIMYCLSWLFYDEVIDSVSKDELINNTNKVDMWGAADFTVDGQHVVVSRWRKGGKSNRENGASLVIDGVDKTPASVDDVTAKIEELIGIDFELFSRIVMFSATNRSFFSLPTTSASNSANQTSMIEQLFDLEMLSEKAGVLKKQIKATEVELATQKRLIEQVDKQVADHQVLISNTEQRVAQWEGSTARQISNIETDLATVESIDFDAERQIHNSISELNSIRSELNTVVSNTNTRLTTIAASLRKSESEAASLSNSTCPYCHQHYADSLNRLQHVQEEIAAYEATHTKLTKQIRALTAELDQTTAELTAVKQTAKVSNFEQMLNLKSQHQALQVKLEGLRNQVNPFIDVLNELRNATPTSPSYDAANELTTLQQHQNFLLKLLTKKDSFVRKALLHKSLPFLNERLATHLEDLGLPHKVEFTPSLTASITQFGRELSYGCLSNGQKARVNFALSLAFGDVLQYVHQKINIQLFDEVLDVGLDRQGLLAATELLKRKAKREGLSLFIISHRDEVQDLFDRTLVVRHVDGFSQLSTE